MKDETYAFVEDVREKAITRRSARYKRTHCGRGGRVRMPSDNLTKKELEKMSGECASFRLNEPATWADFMKMPDDIKVMYISLLKKKWDVPVSHIGKMMGVSQTQIQRETARLGMVFGKGANKAKWDKDGFYNWVNGVKTEPVEIPVTKEELLGHCLKVIEPVEEAEETPVAEDDKTLVIDKDKHFFFDDFYPLPKLPETAVPDHGDMTFKCTANMALETIKQILANENVEIRVSWRVIDGDVC